MACVINSVKWITGESQDVTMNQTMSARQRDFEAKDRTLLFRCLLRSVSCMHMHLFPEIDMFL